jgi:hypothetical protein
MPGQQDHLIWGHMKELVHTQRSNERNALLQRILDTAHDIQNSCHILEDVTTSVIHNAQMCIQVTGRHFHY